MDFARRLRGTTGYAKVSSYWRICLRISSTFINVALVNGVVVLVYMSGREKGGHNKLYDPPIWHGFSEKEKQEIINRRQSIVSAVRGLYESNQATVADPRLTQLFSEGCVLEDPMTRCVGLQDMLRAFRLLPKVFSEINFTEFRPIHHEHVIQIEAVKVAKMKDASAVERESNLIIHLTREGEENEKVCHVVDEWNCVPLLQPETHNKYLFVGSTAKFLRRLITWYYYWTLEEKSWYNPFRVRDLRDTFLNKGTESVSKALEETASESKHRETIEGQDKVFNAGQIDIVKLAK